MQVNELLDLTQWIETNIKKTGVIEQYNQLISILQYNLSKPNGHPLQAFEDQKNSLINTLTAIEKHPLSDVQVKALETLGISQGIGAEGINQLNQIMNNTLDLAYITSEIQNINSKIQTGIANAESITASLAPLEIRQLNELPENNILTRVKFDHDAKITDINELKEWMTKWFDIGRGFAIANSQTPEDIKVIGASKGSIILELALLATTALPIAKAISIIMDCLVKFQEFRLKAEEVRKMKNENESFAEDLEKDAERWEERAEKIKTETVERTTREIIPYFDNYQKSSNAELTKAVKTLVDFIAKGGEVDCAIPTENSQNESPENEKLKILRDDLIKIKNMKEKFKIEHKIINT